MELTKLEKGKAMKCLGDMIVRVENDPDPNTQDKLITEFNCKNCNWFKYCVKLSETFR